MTEYRGFVKRINEKSGKSKRPPFKQWFAYSCKIEKDDGTEYDEWLSLGFEQPKFQQGDYVKMEASRGADGYFKVDPASIQVKKNPPARKEAQPESAVEGTSSSSRGNYSPSKGGVDWNSSVARAIEMVDLLIRNEALPMTGAKGKSAEAKRFDEINAAVDKLTVRFYNDVKTLRVVDVVADTVTSTKADGALPPAEDEGEDEPEAGADNDEDF